MKTIHIKTVDLDRLRLVLGKRGNVFLGYIYEDGSEKLRIEGAEQEDVWRRLHDEAGRLNPMYIGFDGARARFRRFFPDGFYPKPGTPDRHDYLFMERNYKVEAKERLDANAPVEKCATGSGFAEAILPAFRINLINQQFELPQVRKVLQSPTADNFIRAAARFTLGDTKTSLLEMEAALKPHRAAKWTIVTLLPFLWQPEAHMYLKPEAMKDFAQRVGHRFAHDYEARLDLRVYESLRDLASRTADEIAELRPRDRIDGQSFIWVVGNYKEGDAATAKA